MPVADFYCSNCHEEFELKSKKSKIGKLGKKIVDGAFDTMINRITSSESPNFLFLTYDEQGVNNLVLIPSYFFTPSIIERRNPLADTARRAGWVGCNIILRDIPESGKIYIIKQGNRVLSKDIIACYDNAKSLCNYTLEARGWLLDVLSCVDRIRKVNFTLSDVYAFEEELKLKHPNNSFVKDKIRQQLQIIRDKGFIEFTDRGKYRKVR